MEDGSAVNMDAPEVQEAIKLAVAAATANVVKKNAELLSELRPLKKLKDIDPDEYLTLKQQAAAAEAEKLKIAGNWEAREKQLMDAHKKELDIRDSKIATLGKSLEENVLIATASQAISAEKGVAKLLMPHVRSQTRLDDNGNPVVIDDAGNVRIDSAGKPLTISALIAEMKADVTTFGRAFEPSGSSGSGSRGSNGSNGASDYSKMTLTELSMAANNPVTAAAANQFLQQKYGG